MYYKYYKYYKYYMYYKYYKYYKYHNFTGKKKQLKSNPYLIEDMFFFWEEFF